MINDGRHEYMHDFDGDHPELETSGCQASFRNQDYPTYARITYKHSMLKVQLDVKGEGEWETCFMAYNIDLPKGHSFSVSAATGDLADNHDILSIKTCEAPELSQQDIKRLEEASKALKAGEKVEGVDVHRTARSGRNHMENSPSRRNKDKDKQDRGKARDERREQRRTGGSGGDDSGSARKMNINMGVANGGSDGGSSWLTYLFYVIVIAVVAVGGLAIKARMDKNKKHIIEY
eukprot:UC1_evm1s1837